MGFTYYGDLLGISGYYKLSTRIAKEKLNDFYNISFMSLSNYCQNNRDTVSVSMYSDSIIFCGKDPKSALEELHRLYVKLLHKGILLRGGMVKGRLEFEPRLTIDNFDKNLPKDDTLARAVGLESTKKGARLLIENKLAEELLNNYPEWLNHEGYVRKVFNDQYMEPYESILRRICPTPEQDTYECLYFWVCHNSQEHQETDYNQKKQELNEIKSMLQDNIALHYKETIGLLKRCQKRQEFTNKRMRGGFNDIR
jgi:hypothetical protein